MRTNDKNFVITPYAEFHSLDTSKIKIKELDHLLDVDPENRRSNKRPYVDRDAIEPTPETPVIVSECCVYHTSNDIHAFYSSR